MKTHYAAAGAGVALAAGLLLGGAMRPDLAGDDRPAGPQMVGGWNSARVSGPFDDDVASSAYASTAPDAAPPETAAPQRAEVAQAATSVAEPASRRPSDDQVTAYAGDEADATDDPAATPADIDPNAPPEATGDTTPASAG